MAEEPTAQPPRFRLVLDTNIYVRSMIAKGGSAVELMDLATGNFVELVASPQLLDELEGVLLRPKFRRWFTEDEAHDFIAALTLLADFVDDPPNPPQACRDPKDDFLVALFEHSGAHILVSDDNDLHAVERWGLYVRTLAEALSDIRFRHPWGAGYLPGEFDQAWNDAQAHGATAVIEAASAFLAVLNEPNARELLPFVVVPDTLATWRWQLKRARRELLNRGMTSRPDFPELDKALVRLPPDPGIGMRATGPTPLPGDTAILIMHRCSDVEDLPGTNMGQWRAFGYRRSQGSR